MLEARRNAWYVVTLLACSGGSLSGCASEPDATSSVTEGETLQGELERVVITDPEHGASSIDYFLALANDTWVPLKLDEAPDFEPNLPVKVRGEWIESVFHVEAME